MRLRIAIATIAASVAALTSVPFADAAPIEGQLAGPVALDGWLVYSRHTDDGLWELRARTRTGEDVTLPARTSLFPFDADLGTDAAGKLVAVYARCTPICRIAMLDLASGRERFVPGVHAGGHTETSPTIRDGVLAFQRRPARLRSGGVFRIVTLGAGRPSRVVKRLRSDQNVSGADLTARGLAISTETTAGEGRTVSVQVKPTHRPWRTLQVIRSGALSRVEVTPPAWRGNHLYWGFARRLDAPTRLLVRARVTAQGVTFESTDAPSPLDGRSTITGVALDAMSSEAPIWILVEQAREENYTTAMDAYPVGDIAFGPARRDVGLQR